MAQPLIKFYRSESEPASAAVGSLWFDTVEHTIKVKTTGGWEPYGGNEAIDIASETEKPNFLDVEDDGLAVRSVDTEHTVVEAPITIAGGPLADYAKQVYPNGIPEGESVTDILTKLFLKELFPDAATKPSISIDGDKSLGLLEVGNSVTIPALTMSKNNGQFNAAYSSPEQPTTGITWSNESITVGTVVGFTNISKTGGSTSIASTSATIVEGSNSVNYSASADYSAPVNTPISNLSNPATDAAYTFTASTATTTGSTTATGVYAIYTNGKQLASTNTNDDGAFGTSDTTKLNLVNYTNSKGADTYIGFGSPSVKTWTVYLPQGVSIVSSKGYNPTTKSFDIDYTFEANGTYSISTTYAGTVVYNRFECPGATASNNIKFNIKK